jgi:hypothetical protein
VGVIVGTVLFLGISDRGPELPSEWLLRALVFAVAFGAGRWWLPGTVPEVVPVG